MVKRRRRRFAKPLEVGQVVYFNMKFGKSSVLCRGVVIKQLKERQYKLMVTAAHSSIDSSVSEGLIKSVLLKKVNRAVSQLMFRVPDWASGVFTQWNTVEEKRINNLLLKYK